MTQKELFEAVADAASVLVGTMIDPVYQENGMEQMMNIPRLMNTRRELVRPFKEMAKDRDDGVKITSTLSRDGTLMVRFVYKDSTKPYLGWAVKYTMGHTLVDFDSDRGPGCEIMEDDEQGRIDGLFKSYTSYEKAQTWFVSENFKLRSAGAKLATSGIHREAA